MKDISIIFNPNSGNKKIKKDKLKKYQGILATYGYESKLYVTEYRGHAKEIVKNLSNVDLVLSIGGDGTFNEIVAGNLERQQQLVLSHLPVGTTNDIGAMFGLGKNMMRNLKMILSGEVHSIDVCRVNNQPFVYVAGFGKFMNVPYETPRKLKKTLGYGAYLIAAIRDFVWTKTHLYEVSYEVDQEKYQGLYSFAIISNANRIAGINNFYKDVKLDDHKFEVLFCNLRTKRDIVKSLFYLKTNDITKVPGFYFHKTDHLKLTFKEKLRKPWCIDGEKLTGSENVFDISMGGNFKMMIPTKEVKRLFGKEEKN